MRMKSLVVGMLAAAVMFGSLSTTAEASKDDSYHYDFFLNPDPSPPGYLYLDAVDGTEMGADALKEPEDLFVGPRDQVYIADSGNNRIVILDAELKLLRVIDSFVLEDQEDTFAAPKGLFVTGEGHLYVADTGNGRVVEFDENGQALRAIGAPQSDILRKEFNYVPSKLAVDKAGRIYVVGTGMFDGIVEYDANGEFVGFTGVNKVNPLKRLSDLVWRRLMTKEQRAKMALFIPSEFINIDMNDRGFMYTVNGLNASKRLGIFNGNGVDILRETGFYPPVGDLFDNGTPQGRSVFTDITVDARGFYTAVESARGRLFTYDHEGKLLLVYNHSGDTKEAFRNPVALDHFKEDLIVLDKTTGLVTLLRLTRYGKTILQATDLYRRGEFDQSAQLWSEVLRANANLGLAYTGVGRSLMAKGEYKEAMSYFKLANDRANHSKAFKRYRKEVLRDSFGTIMTIAVVLALLLLLRRRLVLFMKLWKGGSGREANG